MKGYHIMCWTKESFPTRQPPFAHPLTRIRLFLLIFNKRSKLGRFVHLCAVVVAVAVAASNNANRQRVWCGTWPGLMMMGAPNIESMYHIVLLFILEHTSGWSVNFLLFINEGQLTVMMMDLFTQSSDRIRNGSHPYIDRYDDGREDQTSTSLNQKYQFNSMSNQKRI